MTVNKASDWLIHHLGTVNTKSSDSGKKFIHVLRNAPYFRRIRRTWRRLFLACATDASSHYLMSVYTTRKGRKNSLDSCKRKVTNGCLIRSNMENI